MITVLYVATKSTPSMVNFEKSLAKFGYQYERLGSGEKWGGWRHRMQLYQQACSARDPQELIILTDADDVLFTKEPTGLKEQFEKFGTPIVASAEHSCGGNCTPLTNYWKIKGNSSAYTSIYVNCGGMIGKAGDLAKMWKWMYDQGYTDDQRALGSYINNFPDQVSLDVESAIFYVVDSKLEHNFKFDKGRLVSFVHPNDQTTISPYVLHFAGNFYYPAIENLLLANKFTIEPYESTSQAIVPEGQSLPYQYIHTGANLLFAVLFWVFVALTFVFLVTTTVFAVLWQKSRRSLLLTQTNKV